MMKTRILLAVAVAMSWLAVGCGGGGGDSKRTDLSCVPDAPVPAQICASLHSDVPATMSCNPGNHEVAPCTATGALAKCTQDEPPFHALLYVYDASVLSTWETTCTSGGGTWTPLVG